MERPSEQAEMLEQIDALERAGRARRQRMAQLLAWGSIAVAASFLFMLRGDFVYWTRPSAPVDLGGPLEFNLDRESDQAYARIAAVPGEQAARYEHLGRTFRVIPLMTTNVLVRQDLGELGHDADVARGQVMRVEGRLVRDDQARALSRIIDLMARSGVIAPQDDHYYLLIQGERPRSGLALPLKLLGVLLFVAINVRAAWRLGRPVVARGEEA